MLYIRHFSTIILEFPRILLALSVVFASIRLSIYHLSNASKITVNSLKILSNLNLDCQSTDILELSSKILVKTLGDDIFEKIKRRT